MKLWWVLYLKELQENKNTFVLLLVAALCLGGYALSKEGEVLVLVSADPRRPSQRCQ